MDYFLFFLQVLGTGLICSFVYRLIGPQTIYINTKEKTIITRQNEMDFGEKPKPRIQPMLKKKLRTAF